MNGQQLGVAVLALGLALAAASWAWQWLLRRRRIGVLDEFLRSAAEHPPLRPRRDLGPCGHELPGYGANVATSCDLPAGHPGVHQDHAGTTWSRGTRGHDDAVETAVLLLHARRHRAGTGSRCGRCRADVEAVAPAFRWPG